MSLTDRFEPALADGGVITRSDRAPTEYERYGDWARKFFGNGCHHANKDEAVAAARIPGAVARASMQH